MNILMFTNTYLPHVGGVARSVSAFAEEYRRVGHRVIVVAPTMDDAPEREEDVIRVPAIQNFNGSDFSVPFTLPGLIYTHLKSFRPDVVHSHHPFLLGGSAVRLAAAWGIPIVFTHHTQYEKYTHYVPGNSSAMQRFAADLATGYCDLCDAVVAPSQSIADVIHATGVTAHVEVIPTGVDTQHFAVGDGGSVRREVGIPPDALVVGHVGRLAPEKNLPFLARAAAQFLAQRADAQFVIVGSGPSEESLHEIAEEYNVLDRFHVLGIRSGQSLVDAYHAFDVFAFASQSETQGMVVTEAMAAGVPVVAIDAPGVREVVVDKENGRLLPCEDTGEFVAALKWFGDRPPAERAELSDAARRTAVEFSMSRCANRALELYQLVTVRGHVARDLQDSLWHSAVRWLDKEWQIIANFAGAFGGAVSVATEETASEVSPMEEVKPAETISRGSKVLDPGKD